MEHPMTRGLGAYVGAGLLLRRRSASIISTLYG